MMNYNNVSKNIKKHFKLGIVHQKSYEINCEKYVTEPGIKITDFIKELEDFYSEHKQDNNEIYFETDLIWLNVIKELTEQELNEYEKAQEKLRIKQEDIDYKIYLKLKERFENGDK